MNQVFSLIEWIIMDKNPKILYNNKVKVLQLIHMGKWEDIKMLDQITWGTPGSLLCLGFFFCRIRNFLKKYYVIYKKQIKHQKGLSFHLKI